MTDPDSQRIDPTDSDWTPCPHGEIDRAVRQIHWREQHLAWRQMGGLAVVAAAVCLGGYAVVSRLPAGPGALPVETNNVVNFGCRQTQELLESYIAGTVDADVAKRIRVHLDRCPHCREIYERLLARTGSCPFSPTAPAPSRSSLALARE